MEENAIRRKNVIWRKMPYGEKMSYGEKNVLWGEKVELLNCYDL